MKSRVLTAIGLIPFVLGAFFCASPWPLVALAILVGVACTFELGGLLKSRLVWLSLFDAALVAVTPVEDFFRHLSPQTFLVGATLVGILFTLLEVKKPPTTIVGAMSAGWWYIAPLTCLVILHGQPKTIGPWFFKTPLLLAVLPLWGGDTAAIFAGKAFGKHLLAPTISPKKTVEGAIANLLACMLVATPLAIWIGYSWWVGALCGFAAGTFGQIGDLFESYVKRKADVKDSGKLLPGHGGILDRIDSLLLTAPVVALILSFVKYA